MGCPSGPCSRRTVFGKRPTIPLIPALRLLLRSRLGRLTCTDGDPGVLERCADELPVQGMGSIGPRPVLPVELRPHKPGMRGEFDDLHQILSRVHAGHAQTVAGEYIQVGVVHFITMAMSLPHLRFAIGGSGERSWSESARIPPQPHRPYLLIDTLLLRKHMNHRMGCRGIHPGG